MQQKRGNEEEITEKADEDESNNPQNKYYPKIQVVTNKCIHFNCSEYSQV